MAKDNPLLEDPSTTNIHNDTTAPQPTKLGKKKHLGTYLLYGISFAKN